MMSSIQQMADALAKYHKKWEMNILLIQNARRMWLLLKDTYNFQQFCYLSNQFQPPENLSKESWKTTNKSALLHYLKWSSGRHRIITTVTAKWCRHVFMICCFGFIKLRSLVCFVWKTNERLQYVKALYIWGGHIRPSLSHCSYGCDKSIIAHLRKSSMKAQVIFMYSTVAPVKLKFLKLHTKLCFKV